jgi:hypothetical protein
LVANLLQYAGLRCNPFHPKVIGWTDHGTGVAAYATIGRIVVLKFTHCVLKIERRYSNANIKK